MAKQTINIGTAANSKNGDPLRTAFTKVMPTSQNCMPVAQVRHS